MILPKRIELLVQLGKYIEQNSPEWQAVKENASRANPWFVPEFIEMASSNIFNSFLDKNKLEQWAAHYNMSAENSNPQTIGIVMAGNLPMVGFHDMLCAFVAGQKQLIKPSSKDDILLKHLVAIMADWYPPVVDLISFADTLKGCDAYIATGSNNSSRYFEYYFGKYPHIIRRNRTSVAILDGSETTDELDKLADDLLTYFGLGCRNVTKLYVPENYPFEPLLNALNKYEHYSDFHKYRHNYDYQLALLMMGNKYYMTNGTALLSENNSLFSAISHVHYQFYKDAATLEPLKQNPDVQCIVGHNHTPFGKAQQPLLSDYADGVDTVQFALRL